MALTIQFDREKKVLDMSHAALRNEAMYKGYAEKATTTELAQNIERMDTIIRFAQALGNAGFDVTVGSWDTNYFTYHVKREDLTKVYKALGHLKPMGKEVENARRRLVKVTLRAEAFPDYCRITYDKKLPRGKLTDSGEGQNCKIVRRVQPRKVEYVLECSSS